MKDLTLSEWQLVSEAVGNKILDVDVYLSSLMSTGTAEDYNKARHKRRVLALLMRKIDRRVRSAATKEVVQK